MHFFLMVFFLWISAPTAMRLSAPRMRRFVLQLSSWDDLSLGEPLNKPQPHVQKLQLLNTSYTKTAVFVGNLPFSYTTDQLTEFARSHDASQGLTSARIQLDFKQIKSRGFGYLDYSQREDAEIAAAKLRGLEIDGRVVKIDLDAGSAGPNKGRRIDPTSKEFSVFVGNLDYSLREKDVEDIFRREMLKDEGAMDSMMSEGSGASMDNDDDSMDHVASKSKIAIKCRIHKLDDRSKGFGHVDFADAESVKNALFLNGFEVMGRPLIVERANGINTEMAAGQTPSKVGRSTPSIFIGNIDFEVTADDILEMTNELLGTGFVKKIRLSVDRETGKFRGFGHLDFSTDDDAAKALLELSEVELFGRKLRVDKAEKTLGRTMGVGRAGGDIRKSMRKR